MKISDCTLKIIPFVPSPIEFYTTFDIIIPAGTDAAAETEIVNDFVTPNIIPEIPGYSTLPILAAWVSFSTTASTGPGQDTLTITITYNPIIPGTAWTGFRQWLILNTTIVDGNLLSNTSFTIGNVIQANMRTPFVYAAQINNGDDLVAAGEPVGYSSYFSDDVEYFARLLATGYQENFRLLDLDFHIDQRYILPPQAVKQVLSSTALVVYEIPLKTY